VSRGGPIRCTHCKRSLPQTDCITHTCSECSQKLRNGFDRCSKCYRWADLLNLTGGLTKACPRCFAASPERVKQFFLKGEAGPIPKVRVVFRF